jgi:LuxR family maltose regulon positive regulatory protein
VQKSVFHSNAPKVSKNQPYLERSRLDALLKQAIQGRLIVVTAGTGYGKTHTIYSFVQKCDARTYWMQFSERDNTGEHFWENFVNVVGSVEKEGPSELRAIGFPTTERQFERYVAVPQRVVITHKKYICVYDDLHLLRNPEVIWFMKHFVTIPFPNITSILISRTEMPFNLINWISKGMVTEINEDHLRFSREEMIEYLKLQNINLSSETSAALYGDTEGWPFAIHLASLFLKKTPGREYVSQALRTNVFKLIKSEIMGSVSPELRKFLIRLSLIDNLSPQLLMAIGNESLIGEMEKLGSFIRFDAYRNVYRIHNLFLHYLSGLQNELSGAEKREVYSKAAAWCAANDQKLDAMNYYEKAGEYLNLMALIDTLPLIMPQPTARMLLEMMNRVPEGFYKQYPMAHVTHTRLFITLMMFDKAKAELSEIIAGMEAGDNDQTNPDTARVLRGLYCNMGSIGYFLSTFTRDYSFIRFFERAHYYTAFSSYQPTPPISVGSVSSYICRAGSHEKGETDRYNRAIDEMIPHMAAAMGGCFYGANDLAWGELAFFRGNLADAERFSLTALGKARKREQYELENRALFILLRIHLSRGNPAILPNLLSQLEAQLTMPRYLNRFIHYDMTIGWFYAQIEQPEKLAPWLKNDFEESDLNSLVHGTELLVKAKYHFAEQQYSAALATLKSRQEQYGLDAFALGRLEKKVLEAVCRYRLKDKEGAYEALEAAWEQAHPNGLYMPFTELGRDMRNLTEAALKDKATAIPPVWLEQIRLNASTYAKKLFKATEKYRNQDPEAETEQKIGTVLSRRETQVLRDLSKGMTREEIAGDAGVSLNAVKNLIRSIYHKLGALNRADAVRIATRQGIIKK